MYREGWFSLVKGVVVALAVSLLCTLLFSAALRLFPLPSGCIYPVNQGIKLLSLSLGVFSFVRGEKGWCKGGGIGLFYTMLSYLVFAAVGGDFSLSWLIIVELFLGVFSGALCGIIAVNVCRG